MLVTLMLDLQLKPETLITNILRSESSARGTYLSPSADYVRGTESTAELWIQR
jgi:hypothetical protein